MDPEGRRIRIQYGPEYKTLLVSLTILNWHKNKLSKQNKIHGTYGKYQLGLRRHRFWSGSEIIFPESASAPVPKGMNV